MFNVKITTIESEFECKVKRSATGKDVFETMVKITGLRETKFFGLEYQTSSGQLAWLKNDKKLSDHKMADKSPFRFGFKVKFFPESVEEDVVIQEMTVRMIFKQVRSDILNHAIYCPADKAVLLASYDAQYRNGDAEHQFSTWVTKEVREAAKEGEYDVDPQKMLPKVIVRQHNLSDEEWKEKIHTLHRQHRGLTKEEAMREYLKIAQSLEMFGVSYFEVTNKKGTDIWLGIHATGINFYDLGNRLNPKVGFTWPEISKVTYSKEKFEIDFLEKDAKTHKVTGKLKGSAKQMFEMAMGYHTLARARLMPPSLEVQQMKLQRQRERQDWEREKAAIRKDVQDRLDRERRTQELRDFSEGLGDWLTGRLKEDAYDAAADLPPSYAEAQSYYR